MDSQRLTEAVSFATAKETRWPRDLSGGLSADLTLHEPEPWNAVIGPTRPRGGPAGLVLKDGKTVARWGDTGRADMTFSVAKSYLSLLTGVAVDQQLIRSIDDPVRDYALDDGFSSPRNHPITWRQLLQQTSEWEGTLFGKPDLVDRNRQVGPDADNSAKGTFRELRQPGTFWEYNDVRVNRLSLSLLHVFRRSLADVFAEYVTDPIGCSRSWEWLPYRNSWVNIDGRSLPCVPGGGHWGGGVFMNAEDQARLGLLVLDRGQWAGRQVISEKWFDELATPCPLRRDYGLMWWLNTDRLQYSNASPDSVFAIGAGQNLTWVSPQDNVVVVARWIDQRYANEFFGLVSAALR